jgi:hypothetical protein
VNDRLDGIPGLAVVAAAVDDEGSGLALARRMLVMDKGEEIARLFIHAP